MTMTETFGNVNHLVLNFYPDGYSLAVKLNEFPVFTSETILETAKISYEETSLLDYIENEELPPILVEMIDGSPKLSQYKIWHNGCLILEVRDKINVGLNKNNRKDTTVGDRDTANNTAKEHKSAKQIKSTSQWSQTQFKGLRNGCENGFVDSCLDSTSLTNNGKASTNPNNYFILLKPTNLSMLNDVLNLTESSLWSTHDRLQLESQIVLHNSPRLFLEPDATKQSSTDQDNPLPNVMISNIINTKHKKKLPHKKTKSIHSHKNGLNQQLTPGNSYSNNNTNNDRSSIYQSMPDSLPPELVLQQFLATRRGEKKTFAAGHLARFNRFKKHSNNNLK